MPKMRFDIIMPSEAAHIAVANRNQDTIEYLVHELEKHSAWIATIAFYKALHVVEAVFCADQSEHTRTHEKRESLLKTTHKYQNIYKHYAPLMRASKVARYLDDKGQEAPVFSAWIKPEEVVSDLLNNRLTQIEKTARKFLKSPNDLRTWSVA